jgi:tRNA (mo5U34)-methyltransferase
MTQEQILLWLEKLQPWFHQIDLGNGLSTKTVSAFGEPVDHPVGVWNSIKNVLPRDLTGKSVLDVGCNAGFYSIEAKRRGADRVLGVDGQRQHVRQAVFVRQILGLDIEYRRANVYELTRSSVGEFDVVLALGLIYHLKHLILALENLYSVTREVLIIETAVMPQERTPEPFFHDLGRLVPLAYLDNPLDAKEQVFNWFLPSVDALTALLKTVGFTEIEIAEVKGERTIAICRKRAIVSSDALSHRHIASLTLLHGPTLCQPNEELSFRLRVANTGLEVWPRQGHDGGERGAVHLGAHLLKLNEDEVAWDYARAELPNDLLPGAAVEIDLKVRAPENPDTYIVEFDMVAEHVSWFEDYGSGTLRHELRVSNG